MPAGAVLATLSLDHGSGLASRWLQPDEADGSDLGAVRYIERTRRRPADGAPGFFSAPG